MLSLIQTHMSNEQYIMYGQDAWYHLHEIYYFVQLTNLRIFFWDNFFGLVLTIAGRIDLLRKDSSSPSQCNDSFQSIFVIQSNSLQQL
jgi:hypothetical protein